MRWSSSQAERTVCRPERLDENTMSILLITVPLMLLAIAFAIVPLTIALRADARGAIEDGQTLVMPERYRAGQAAKAA